MCDRCDALEFDLQRAQDELVRWKLYVNPDGLVPPGAAARTLRLAVHLNQIRRQHLHALRAAAADDPDLAELRQILTGMTGL